MNERTKDRIWGGVGGAVLATALGFALPAWLDWRNGVQDLRTNQAIVTFKEELLDNLEKDIRAANEAALKADATRKEALEDAKIIEKKLQQVEAFVDKTINKNEIDLEALKELLQPDVISAIEKDLPAPLQFTYIQASSAIPNQPVVADGKWHGGEVAQCPTGFRLLSYGLRQHNAYSSKGWHYCECTQENNGVQARYNTNDNNPNGGCNCYGLCAGTDISLP